jgi:crossover junction endodeoxyribonuclease RusA
MNPNKLPPRYRAQVDAPATTLTTLKRSFTLPYPPSVNNLYATVRGRRVLSAKGRAYKATVESIVGRNMIEGEVAVAVAFYRPARRGDLDNTLKALLDALTGLAYHDDSQVAQIGALRYEDRANPRAEVIVSKI